MIETHVLMPRLMTPKQVASLTGRAQQTLAIDRMKRVGLPFVKLSSGCVRYKACDVFAFIEAHTVQPQVHLS